MVENAGAGGTPPAFVRLEVDAQTELHVTETVFAQNSGVVAKSWRSELIVKDIEVRGGVVESNRVGDVEHFPCEFHPGPLSEIPALGQRRIDVEHAVSAELVSHSGFTWIRQAHRRTVRYAFTDCRVIREDLRQSVFDVLVYLDGSSIHSKGLKLPVGGPSRLDDREGQPTGPTTYA